MTKQFEIIIDGNDFAKGIGDSPYVGNGMLKHCDIDSQRGVIKSNPRTVLTSSFSAKVVNIEINKGNGDTYAMDRDSEIYSFNGSVWSKIAGGGNGNANEGLNMGIWKNHIFVFRLNAIDVYSLGSSSWTVNWQPDGASPGSFNGDVPIVNATDDKLYWGNGFNIIGSLMEDTTFDPSASATYTYKKEALDLPSDEKVTTLKQINDKLAIGFFLIAGVDASGGNGGIYLWDMVSTSFESPITIHDKKISQMVEFGGVLHVACSGDNNIYVTDFSRADLIKKFHFNQDNFIYNYNLNPQFNAIKIINNKIFIGVSGFQQTHTFDRPLGVYSLDVKNGNVLNYEQTISTGGTDSYIYITAISSYSYNAYLVAWEDSASYGIDIIKKGVYRSDNSIEFESRLYKIGTKRQPKTLQSITVDLENSLTNDDQGVTLQYRENAGDSWITIGSKKTRASNGSFDSWTFDFAPTLKSIQVKAILDESASLISGDSMIALESITIR